MTNDLKNFLEEQNSIFYKTLCDSDSNEGVDDYGLWIFNGDKMVKDIEIITQKHNTRLINFVLDLVAKEVEKKKGTDFYIGELITIDDISTIINKLRV